ncbi:MAG: hypothetical protein ACTJLM_00300 [Ehrlichia sp.]
MKIPSVISALASLLVLYSHGAFSLQTQSNIFMNDENHKLENDVKCKKEEAGNEISTDHIIVAAPHLSLDNFASRKGRIKFTGDAMFYIWNSDNNTKRENVDNRGYRIDQDLHFYCDLGKNCEAVGAQQDSIINIGIESNQDKYGNTYGINLVSHASDRDFSNRESKVIVKTPYGNLLLGYQEGVESSMRLDASSIAVGDTHNSWVKHLRGLAPGFASNGSYFIYNFIFQPGLYTESMNYNYCNFISNEILACTIDLIDQKYSVISSYRKLLSRLPFRLSYQSQSFMGLKFGISYAPFSYNRYLSIMNFIDKKAMLGSHDRLAIDESSRSAGRVRLKNGMEFYGAGPQYKQIVSGGVSYTYHMDDVKFSTSVIGEYGKNMNDYIIAGLFNADNLKYDDLQGIAVGLEIDYGKVRFAGAYGYLGTSGFYIPKCSTTNDVSTCERYNAYAAGSTNYKHFDDGYVPIDSNSLAYTDISSDYRHFDTDDHENDLGYGIGESVVNEKDHNVINIINLGVPKYNSYYWNIGIGYQYKSLDLSMTYFQSNRIGHILKDVSVGFEYNFLKYGGFQGGLFSNFHHYVFDQAKSEYQSDRPIANGKGYVLLVGMKLKF